MSYPPDHAGLAERLFTDLTARGYRLWMDRHNIRPGSAFSLQVDEALRNARLVIGLLSPTSLEGSQSKELLLAREFQKPILPAMAQACPLPDRLKDLTILDFTSDYADGLARLLMGIEANLPTTAPTSLPKEKPAPSGEHFAVAGIDGYEEGSPLIVAQEYKLHAGIQHRVPEGFQAQAVQLPVTEPVMVNVVVRAPEMEIRPNWMQSVRVASGEESPLVEFTLIPRSAGSTQFEVLFYYERHWLTQLDFKVQVVNSKERKPASNLAWLEQLEAQLFRSQSKNRRELSRESVQTPEDKVGNGCKNGFRAPIFSARLVSFVLIILAILGCLAAFAGVFK